VADYKYIGKNYTTPDLIAKVTGKARYAEDFRADGMLFCKLLLSPMPHARVTRIDTSAAEAMPGVKAILTPKDLVFPPPPPPPPAGQPAPPAPMPGERALAEEPLYQGEPILAVAAVDELTAADAIEKIRVEYEPLPFVVNPLDSLRPGGPNARTMGNVWVPAPPPAAAPAGGPPPPPTPPQISELKWTDEDFAAAGEGRLPMGKVASPADEWVVGDVEAGFKQADLVLDETFLTQSTGHQPLETRTAMAYWQNGKLYLHGSTQSTVQTIANVARWVGVTPDKVVIISEYTGGGFGSKIPGAISMSIPALLSKKANAPVMMRITREEEHYIGRARAGVLGRVKIGFRKDGRITAIDMFTITDNGPYDRQGDGTTAGRMTSIAYQPLAMRFRTVTVLTNTPPRVSQRNPGGMQGNAIIEPILQKAAKQLGIDQVAMRRINSPEGKAPFGPPLATGKQAYMTSAFVKEAIDRGAELFKWEEKKRESGQRRGSKVRGVGLTVGPFVGGSVGFDGLFVIKPDGRVAIQSGIGNLGTHSMFDVHRVVPEFLGVAWEKCDITFGNTARHLPWSCVSAGSQTAHAMTRAAHAAVMDAKKKLQEIAAKDLGGKPEDYDVGNERVFRKGSPGRGLTFAQAAKRAIELGGPYDGHELPKDINALTRTSATALAGQGLMAVAKDNYKRDGVTHSFVVGFAQVEVDVETGAYKVLDYLAVGDVGTVLHPHSLGGQLLGGSMLGIGHAIGQNWVYDTHYGLPLAKRFYQNKPPTILDAPQHMQWDAVDQADPETPVGVRGVGEPPVGSGFGAVLNALTDALGDNVFRRAPVTADLILTSLEAGKPMHDALTAHV
jgi:CO/xanthine dehydrogenase Mo-binding subunit